MQEDIERELVGATGLKTYDPAAADRQEFLLSVAAAVDKLPDEEWKRLTDPAQAWANKASTALGKGTPIPDFSKANGQDGTPATSKKKSKSKAPEKKAKPPVEKKSKPVEKKATKPKPKIAAKPVGAQAMIKKLVLKNPNATTDEILEKLGKAGFHPTKFAVSTIRTGTRQTLKIIQEEGIDVRKLEL